MPELHLQRSGSTLEVILGERQSSFPLTDVALSATTWEHIYDDAAAYGRELFDKTFRDEQLRTMLANLPANERLVLVAEDPVVAAIPWEYLRDRNNKLLASRLNVVRGVPEAQRRDDPLFACPLEIIAIPVSPVDEPRVLNVEREWKNLAEAITVTSPPKSLTLRRVRPPTRSQLERSLGRQCTSIVHFMGHSTSHDGKAFLVFEDASARSHLVDAADFADSLNSRVFLVVFNSCLSAVAATTEFGNIARALVPRGVPYALGMQFILPDDAALVMSDALYDFLLQEHSVEEAVMYTRRALEESGKLSHPHWLAGIPVLYTSLRRPAAPIELTVGQPTIQPDVERLQQICDLAALPQAEHFIGRGQEISAVLDVLLSPHARGFVLLHGLGGIGKTVLARAVAERVSWHYSDRVLAVSFESFANLDSANPRMINEQFADSFYNRLARFYDLDPAQYLTTAELQQAILQRRQHTRSLLVLDNIETLVDAQRQGHAAAKSLASFISRLKEADSPVLLTSRIVPPSDWGNCKVVPVSGLSDGAGADLLLALLPRDRKLLAPFAARLALSQRVQGHPLSIRLLAGRFADETAMDLTTFLAHIEAELAVAEQATPTSLEDPDRQKTLYACMDYSVKRLLPEQREVLAAISAFQAPFPPEFASDILDNKERTLVHLQNLVRLALLEAHIITFKEGTLLLLELHPMLRWYIQRHLEERDVAQLERYGMVYEQLTRIAWLPEDGFDQSSLVRYLVVQSLPDCDAALHYLSPADKSSLTYHLAKLYQRLGQIPRALALFELALELEQEQDDKQGIASRQYAIAEILKHRGQEQEALALYEQSLRLYQEVGDVEGVMGAQFALAEVLRQQEKPEEALALYEQALAAAQEVGNDRGIAVIQNAIGEILLKRGKRKEALALYEKVLQMKQALGDVREAAVTRYAMAYALEEEGRLDESLALYESAFRTAQELGDVREMAIGQHGMAEILIRQGKLQEALALYEHALQMKQALGDIREVAVTQHAIAEVLVMQGKLEEAMALYGRSLHTKQALDDRRGMAATHSGMAEVLVEQGKLEEALNLYRQALVEYQEVGAMQSVAATQQDIAQVLARLGKEREALAHYEQALHLLQKSGDVESVAATQYLMAEVLRQQGKLEEALALSRQALSTAQTLGDRRGVAVAQSRVAEVLMEQGKLEEALVYYDAFLRSEQEQGNLGAVAAIRYTMANVLEQLNKPQEALVLYEQALSAFQELENRREAAATQHKIANALVNAGRLQEALMLYKQSIRTFQELGNRPSIAITQRAMADVLVDVGEPQAALALYEKALPAFQELEDIQNVALVQHSMANAMLQLGELEESLTLFQQALQTRQQLGDAGAVATTQSAMATVLTLQEKAREAVPLYEQSLNVLQESGDIRGVAKTQANLCQLLFLQGEDQRAMSMAWAAYTSLNQHNFSQDAWIMQQLLVSIKGRMLGPGKFDAIWGQVISEPEPDWLRDVQEISASTLPFDEKLISRSIAALLGGPPEKLTHTHYLASMANETENADLKQLINTIQLALFSSELSQFGQNLSGIYREAWQAIVDGVESGGVDPEILEAIVHNTLAVLGSGVDGLGKWRSVLVEVRNAMADNGLHHFVMLLDAVIELLDAGGNPAGLGKGLQGIYTKTWEKIVKQIEP